MKLMIASDIHGSCYYAERMRRLYEEEGADRLILLGDLLYHGPRNDLPKGYDPRGVIEILNSMKQEILAVRGNCDTEVDQMVLNFPIMADYAVIYDGDVTMFLSHGHIYNPSNVPNLKNGDYLLNGHTHIPAIESMKDFVYINPGSVSIPKSDCGHTYMIYKDGGFTLKKIED